MSESPTASHVETISAVDADDAIDVIISRQPEGSGFSFKVRRSGRIYRLDVARDRSEPRFWRLRVSRCVTAGYVDTAEQTWFGGERMTRDDIAATIANIRADVGSWLTLPYLNALRGWVFEDAVVLAAPTVGKGKLA